MIKLLIADLENYNNVLSYPYKIKNHKTITEARIWSNHRVQSILINSYNTILIKIHEKVIYYKTIDDRSGNIQRLQSHGLRKYNTDKFSWEEPIW